MTREAIDTLLERTTLALVASALGYGILAFGGVRASDFVIMGWLVFAATAVWIIRIWLAPRFRFLWPPLCWSIPPFVAYAAWRYRAADIEFVARQEFLQILVAALLLLVIVNNLYDQESIRLLTLGLVFIAMFSAMYGIYQWLGKSDLIWGLLRPPGYSGRASGTYICPNHLAGLLEMMLPVAIGLVASARMSVLLRIAVAYAGLIMIPVGSPGTELEFAL